MTWVRLDDKFWRNPKMRKLSHAARGVFADMLSFCGDTAEPTGFLTYRQACDLATGSKHLVAALAENGNLEDVNGGYLIHDFEHYLPKTSTERVRAWREKKRSEDVSETFQKRSRNVSPLARARRVPDPVPDPEPEGVENPLVVPPHGIASRGWRGENESVGQVLGRFGVVSGSSAE